MSSRSRRPWFDISNDGVIYMNDKNELKRLCSGRWPDILTEVARIPREHLDPSREHPCPKCGGETRFRLVDQEAGACRCSHCFATDCGDGLAVVRWMLNITFPDALNRVAEYIGRHPSGSPNGANGKSPAKGKADPFSQVTRLDKARMDAAFETFVKAKPPVTTDALRVAGAIAVKWPYRSPSPFDCIAMPVRQDPKSKPHGILLALSNGEKFPAFKSLPERRFHLVKGSTNGWVFISPGQRIADAETVWICEGPSDALSLAGVLPDGHAVITAACGAKGRGKLSLSFLAGKRVVIVADNDDAGRDGADELRTAIGSIADARVISPPGQGKDVRDFLNAGGTFDELARLADEAESRKPSSTEPHHAAETVKSTALARLDDVLARGVGHLYLDAELMKGLARVSIDDPSAYAAHRETLRKAGVKLRDFDKALRPLVIEAAKAQPTTFARGDSGGFFIDSGCLCREKLGPDGPIIVPLCNFTAEIVDETIRDDGVESSLVLGLQGALMTGRPLSRIEVPAVSFMTPDKWVVPQWGADATVWPGETRCLAPAIQATSKNKRSQTVFAHTGWRLLPSGWAYLHGGGAITAREENSVAFVSLGPPLDRFTLPSPPTGDSLLAAVRASLAMLNVAPPKITATLLAAVYRAVLGACDFSLFLVGLTGIGKSEIAALGQQHFGAGLDARHLPGSWSSTANSLEAVAFLAKDALLVCDDFCPSGGVGDVSKYHQMADRLLRAQGNASGRQRMRPDGTLRPAKPPRGLILSTGEDVPVGQSLRARMLILELAKNEVGFDRLTDCQNDARSGLYAQSLAAFIRWVAPQHQEIVERHHVHVEKIRDEIARSGNHARTPSHVAELAFGWRTFLRFAMEAGAIDSAVMSRLSSLGQQSLLAVAAEQTSHHEATDPVKMFLRWIGSAIASGAAHVADSNGNEPDSPQTWGWRHHTIGTGAYERSEWRPQGQRIGWLETGNLYLEPGAAFSVAQSVAQSHGRAITVTEMTLWKRMKEHVPPVLQSWEENGQRNTIRKVISGERRAVIHLKPESLFPPESDNPTSDESGQLVRLVQSSADETPLGNANEFDELSHAAEPYFGSW